MLRPQRSDGCLDEREIFDDSIATAPAQRDISASISSCIRCLYSSDHAAPDFWFSLLGGLGSGTDLLSRGDFLMPGLSLRVDLGVMGLDECIVVERRLLG